MSTINKSLIKNYVMFEQKHDDTDDNYPSPWAFVFGLVHIVCGLFSIALGIGSICTQATGYFIGYGIWCGFLFILSGGAVLITGFTGCARTWTIMLSMAFGMMAVAASIVQFSIGIVAASNDSGNNLQTGRLTSASTTGIQHYDIFYIRQGVSNYCAGSGFTSSSWGAVDVLLIIVAFVEAVVATATAVFGCRSMCYGQVKTTQQMIDVQPQLTAPPNYSRESGFYNGGYN